MGFPRCDEHLLHQFPFVKHRDFFGKRFADLQLITLLDANQTLDLFVRGTARPGRRSTVIYPNVINFDSVHIYFSRWPSAENLSFRRHNSERNMANKQGGGKPRELPLSNTRKINVLFWGTNQRSQNPTAILGKWMNDFTRLRAGLPLHLSAQIFWLTLFRTDADTRGLADDLGGYFSWYCREICLFLCEDESQTWLFQTKVGQWP